MSERNNELRTAAEILRLTHRKLAPEFRGQVAQEIDRLAAIELQVLPFVKRLAEQHKSDEWTHALLSDAGFDHFDNLDWIGAMDHVIDEARAILDPPS